MVDGIERFGELLDGVGVRAGEPLGGRPQQVERALQDMIFRTATCHPGDGEVSHLPYPSSWDELRRIVPSRCEHKGGPVGNNCKVCSKVAWLFLVIMVLNAGYAGLSPSVASKMAACAQGRFTAGQAAGALRLWENVDFFCESVAASIPDKNWNQVLKSKNLSYSGEVIKAAQRVTWKQVEAGLPSDGACARIPAVELAEGAVNDFLLHPEIERESSGAAAEGPSAAWKDHDVGKRLAAVD